MRRSRNCANRREHKRLSADEVCNRVKTVTRSRGTQSYFFRFADFAGTAAARAALARWQLDVSSAQ